MTREAQWKLLRNMLRNAPGHALTVREIHVEGYIQNVADAAMQARKHRVNITTEYLDKSNPKIASYVLHEKPRVGKVYGVTVYEEVNAATGKVTSRYNEKTRQTDLFPDEPKNRAYR